MFHALPGLRTDEVADVVQAVHIRVTNLLGRRGLLDEHDGEQLVLRAEQRDLFHT